MEDLHNTTREIPYGKNILINCPICGFKGEPAKYRKGNIFLEIILWFLLIIPGVIYTALRHINTFCCCPKCKQHYLFETDGDDKLIDNLINIRKKQMTRFWIIVSFFLILGFFDIFWYKGSNDFNFKQNYGITNSVDKQANPINTNHVGDTNVKVENTIYEQKELVKHEESTKQLYEEAEKKEVESNSKSLKEQVSDSIQEAVDGLNKQYEYITYFESASCSKDCSRRIIDMKFSQPGFINDSAFKTSIKGYIESIYNKLKEIKDVPVQINFIYGGKLYVNYTASKDGVKEKENAENIVREKMKNILKQIDYKYGEDIRLKQDSYIGANCSGDCINGIVNIEFGENIGWYDFTVKAHQADWANAIIRDIPGFFSQIQINFICKGQTISSCIFTEYQMNSMAPKGCTYYGYKD